MLSFDDPQKLSDQCLSNPHAYHQNLPSHYIDSDGIPFLTKYADKKARTILDIVRSIHLTEDSFLTDEEENECALQHAEDEDDIFEPTGTLKKKNTIASIVKKCGRIYSLLSSLESQKYSGLTQKEICEILIKTLHLLSATVTFGGDISEGIDNRITIEFDDVGYLYNVKTKQPNKEKEVEANKCITNNEVFTKADSELTKPFALPSPARESLLSIALHLLAKKSLLRSVSNTSITNPCQEADKDEIKNNSSLLIIHWKALFRMLLRTSPYLDELRSGLPHIDSNSRQNSVLKRTVNLIRQLRRFYNQGLEIKDNIITDTTAREVWDMVKSDLIYRTYSNACYRAAILMYLFSPSRCSSGFYEEVIPKWMESWTSVDRCADFDFIFLAMFCRARKYLEPGKYDWAPLRRRILTFCGFWLQLPVGGKSTDKSFPQAGTPKYRGLPSRLKAFLGSGSPYAEGVNFVMKMASLLFFCVGKIDNSHSDSIMDDGSEIKNSPVSDGTEDLLRFFSFVAPYFNPSNTGSWTLPLGILLHYISYEFCQRLGLAASQITLCQANPALADQIAKAEPYKKALEMKGNEIVVLLDALLPLCQQALYSKNSYVCRAGESALVYLAQIDPVRVCPPFIDTAIRALDICSVTLSHQAPAALSALNRLFLPALRQNPTVLLERLPAILGLSLAGIDGNDEDKTLRTLSLYRNITSWIPVGSLEAVEHEQPLSKEKDNDGTWGFGKGLVKTLTNFCESDKYISALSEVPGNSLLFLPESRKSKVYDDLNTAALTTLIEEATLCLSDWSLAFLERVYSLLRSAGEQEKVVVGLASRHTSADASRARNYSRVLKECLIQVFAAMDSKTFESAIRSVANFLEGETLHMAAKDASGLCEAACAVRTNRKVSNVSSGLDVIAPLLSKNLSSLSKNAIFYRLRCLSGAVRRSGYAVLDHKDAIVSAIKFGLSNSNNKRILKASCKLLRHTLSSQCQSYPITTDNRPRVTDHDCLGKSAHFKSDSVQWHTPSADQIDFVADFIHSFVMNRVLGICTKSVESTKNKTDVEVAKQANLVEWRLSFKVLRYTLRGCSGLLLDSYDDSDMNKNTECGPQELAMRSLILSSSIASRKILLLMRAKLTALIISIQSLIAKGCDQIEDLSAGDDRVTISTLLAADAKICKEVSEIALILLTRRGVSIGSQDIESIWKSQKQLLTDHPRNVQVDEILTVLEKAGKTFSTMVLYKDGEEGGKSLSRRLVTARVHLFLTSIQRQASFDIPRQLRRLRRLRGFNSTTGTKLFNLNTKMENVHEVLSSSFEKDTTAGQSLLSLDALDGYEGLIDGLFAMACHPNTQVRSSVFGNIEYSLTRFGWLIQDRAPRLLNAISLNDLNQKGVYGLPSCTELTAKLDSKGKRTRLAEVLKGICSILAIPRTMKAILATEENRFSLLKTLCKTHHLISLLPSEEMEKMLHYFHALFSQFRSRFFSYTISTKRKQKLHCECISFLLNIISSKVTSFDDKDTQSEVSKDASSIHWRNRLIAGWFMLTYVGKCDLLFNECQLWITCFELIRTEVGQPLQRVALGLFGRLVAYSLNNTNFLRLNATKRETTPHVCRLQKMLEDKKFCQDFGNALVYDHREDVSVGGGHSAQWSFGIQDVLKDSTSNLAPKILFPFKRVNRYSSTFKLQHAQLVHSILLLSGLKYAALGSKHLLLFSKQLAASPPSEDQRNQLCTSAEIFAGVCRALLQLYHNDDRLPEIWDTVILSFLDDVIHQIPTSVMGAFFDALRYGIHNSAPINFFILTKWAVNKIEFTLWKEEIEPYAVENLSYPSGNDEISSRSSTDGFAIQSKWLSLMSAILVEIDVKEILYNQQWLPLYCQIFFDCVPQDKVTNILMKDENLLKSWNIIIAALLPCLLNALGHPYQKCREHIAECLFRICYSYRKLSIDIRVKSSKISTDSRETGEGVHKMDDPGPVIIKKLSNITQSTDPSMKSHHHSLLTAKRFIAYCTHCGDNKNEYSDFIIPLTPLAFEAVKLITDDSNDDISPANRMLQAEVVKGYRYCISEIGVSCIVSYDDTSDISRVLNTLDKVSRHSFWQVRQATAHFLRCFQGCHKFLLSVSQTKKATKIVARLLSDDRREVSSAAMSVLTGILAATPLSTVNVLVEKYRIKANNSIIRPKKKSKGNINLKDEEMILKEKERAIKQQTSVFFLCAAVLAMPYNTPPYVPRALAALSKHSFERSAPFNVREAVKLCCSEFKRTHMSDNWELHRQQFTREQMEALEDVVSTPHYYA